ncbi:MAG: hypothetical protein D4R77_11420 [Planctomycetaceae bacterium]|nr:MAG: hypothetical protein D4R77_11420 [Planctomycetaceae bacterium]
MYDVTTGGTGTTTTGDTVLEMLGDYTHTVLGFCFGYYLAYVRIVTGVDVVVKAGASVDVVLGVKIEMQAALVATLQAAKVFTMQTGTVATLGGLEELNIKRTVEEEMGSHTQVIEKGVYNINSLNENAQTRFSTCKTETKFGDTSFESWESSKNIASSKLILQGKSSVELICSATVMKLGPTSAQINCKLIELN